jgi:hypothetical protein
MSNLYNKIFNINESSNQELYNLHLKPRKEKGQNMPTFQHQKINMIHQADLLFLPTDEGFKYLLVVVDIGSRLCDAVPLKTKEANEIIKAFETIYKRRNSKLKYPKNMEVDAGSEFKGNVKEYFLNKNMSVRVAKAGRHRQQAIVERKNQTIGYVLHQRMNAQELLTGQTSRQWVKFLPKVIKVINEEVEKRKPPKYIDEPLGQGNTLDLIPIGSKVRTVSEKPRDVANDNVLFGNFRKSDIRWNQKQRTVKEILIKPNFPPMYLLDGNIGKRKVEPIARTKEQLQIIKPNEEAPEGEKVIDEIVGKQDTNIVEHILNKKKIGNLTYYLIKWKGYKEPTWAPRKELIKIKIVKKMIEDFEKIIK